MVLTGFLEGVLSGLTKSSDHPSTGNCQAQIETASPKPGIFNLRWEL